MCWGRAKIRALPVPSSTCRYLVLPRPLQRRLRLLFEKSVEAGRAANDGAQLRHLVDYSSKPTRPIASTSGYTVVTKSKEKTSPRGPAAALPSSLSSSSIALLTSRRSEAFGLHPRWVVP